MAAESNHDQDGIRSRQDSATTGGRHSEYDDISSHTTTSEHDDLAALAQRMGAHIITLHPLARVHQLSITEAFGEYTLGWVQFPSVHGRGFSIVLFVDRWHVIPLAFADAQGRVFASFETNPDTQHATPLLSFIHEGTVRVPLSRLYGRDAVDGEPLVSALSGGIVVTRAALFGPPEGSERVWMASWLKADKRYTLEQLRSPLLSHQRARLSYRDALTTAFVVHVLQPAITGLQIGFGSGNIFKHLELEAPIAAIRHSLEDIDRVQQGTLRVSGLEQYFVRLMHECEALQSNNGLQAVHGAEPMQMMTAAHSGQLFFAWNEGFTFSNMLAALRIESALNRFSSISRLLEYNARVGQMSIEDNAAEEQISRIDWALLHNPALAAQPFDDVDLEALVDVHTTQWNYFDSVWRAAVEGSDRDDEITMGEVWNDSSSFAVSRLMRMARARAIALWEQFPDPLAYQAEHNSGQHTVQDAGQSIGQDADQNAGTHIDAHGSAWIYRRALSEMLRSLNLPFRTDFEFRTNLDAGRTIINYLAPHISAMPRQRFVPDSVVASSTTYTHSNMQRGDIGQWVTLSHQERAREQTQYTLRIGLIVAAIAFALDQHMRTVSLQIDSYYADKQYEQASKIAQFIAQQIRQQAQQEQQEQSTADSERFNAIFDQYRSDLQTDRNPAEPKDGDVHGDPSQHMAHFNAMNAAGSQDNTVIPHESHDAADTTAGSCGDTTASHTATDGDTATDSDIASNNDSTVSKDSTIGSDNATDTSSRGVNSNSTHNTGANNSDVYSSNAQSDAVWSTSHSEYSSLADELDSILRDAQRRIDDEIAEGAIDDVTDDTSAAAATVVDSADHTDDKNMDSKYAADNTSNDSADSDGNEGNVDAEQESDNDDNDSRERLVARYVFGIQDDTSSDFSDDAPTTQGMSRGAVKSRNSRLRLVPEGGYQLNQEMPVIATIGTVTFEREQLLRALEEYGLSDPLRVYREAHAQMRLSDEGEMLRLDAGAFVEARSDTQIQHQPADSLSQSADSLSQFSSRSTQHDDTPTVSLLDSAFAPAVAHELPELSEEVFTPAQARIFGAEQALGLAIQRDDVILRAQNTLDRIQSNTSLTTVQQATQAIQLLQELGDPELLAQADNITRALIDEQPLPQLEHTIDVQLHEARSRLRQPSVMMQFGEAIQHLQEVTHRADTVFAQCEGVPRYFNSYAERIVYNHMFATQHEHTVLIPDNLFLAHLDLLDIALQMRGYPGLDPARHVHMLVQYAPSYPMTHLRLAMLLSAQEDWQSARAACLNALRVALDRNDAAFAYYRLAYCMWMSDDFAAAAACYIMSDHISSDSGFAQARAQVQDELHELIRRAISQQIVLPRTFEQAELTLRARGIPVWPHLQAADIVRAAARVTVDQGMFIPAGTMCLAAARMRDVERDLDIVDLQFLRSLRP